MPNNFNFQWKAEIKKGEPKTGEMYIYSIIDNIQWSPEDTSPMSFKSELDKLGDIKQLNIYINSPGGNPFAAMAIFNLVDRCKKKIKVTTYNDGLAASAASILLMMGDKIIIPSNAITMIHRAWTIEIGNANDFRKTANELEIIDNALIDVYMTKNQHLSRDEMTELVNVETWMNAQDALDYGFEIEVGEEKQIAACIKEDKLFAYETGFDIKSLGFKNLPIDKITKITNGVAPSDVSKKKAQEDEKWNAPTLSDFTDKSWEDLTDTEKTNIAGHFAWAAEMPPATYGDLKLPHHNTSGEIVWRGVANAAARLSQSSIPSEDISKVQAHLGAHYKAFDKIPPWEENETENKLTIKTGITPEFEQFSAQLGKAVILLEEIKNELSTEEKPADKSGFFDMQLSEKINQLNFRRNVK